MDIPSDYLINDGRTEKHFEKESFSKYYKKDVFSQFKKNIMDKRLEEAVNWCIELMLSLQNYKVYEILINIACKYVNINNPQLPLKLFNRYKLFLNKKLTEVECRNSQVIRNHIIELCIIVCLSNKSKPLAFYKIKDSEFNLTNIINRLNSQSNHILTLVKNDDPEEIKIMLNEFCDNLKKRKYETTIYWLSLVLEYEKYSNKKDNKIHCHQRSIEGIDPKYQNDVIWLIWTIILNESSKSLCKQSDTQIRYLFKLYKLNFKTSIKYKNCQYIFYALKYFTYNFNINQSLCIDNYLLIQITSFINILFKNKQNNEVSVIKEHITKTNKKKTKKKEKEKSAKSQINQTKKESENRSLQKFQILEQLDNLY